MNFLKDGRKAGYFGAFMAALTSLGGSFTPVKVEPRDLSKPLTGRRGAAAHARRVDLRDTHFIDAHGSLRRVKPKDRSLSGRQRRILQKQRRRETRTLANG